MKSLFALIAAVAVLASAQASFASNENCPKMVKSGRNKLIYPNSAKNTSTVKSVKAVK